MGEYREGFVSSWYDKRDDYVASSTVPSKYYFSLDRATPLIIRVMNTPWRMLPYSCKQRASIMKVVLKNEAGDVVDYTHYFEINDGSINLVDKTLAAGKYVIEFYPSWTAGDV
jgi:hypothetical protein